MKNSVHIVSLISNREVANNYPRITSYKEENGQHSVGDKFHEKMVATFNLCNLDITFFFAGDLEYYIH